MDEIVSSDDGGGKRKRGHALAPAQIDSVSEDKARKITENLIELQSWDKPRTDVEIVQTIDRFFNYCADRGVRPGIETLCTALHITRTTLFRWGRGENCSDFVRDAVIQAKSCCTAWIEQAGLSGALNPPAMIFSLKNWAGYRDTLSIEDRTPTTDRNAKDNDEILSRLSGALGVRDKPVENSDDDSGSGADSFF